MRSIKSNEIYYITICIEGTAIYAYYDEEYKSELDTILVSVDYDSTTN